MTGSRKADVARQLVVRTNDIWPFSAINRLPYHVAIRATIRRLKRLPFVRGLYLKNGLLRPDWVPAVSDIDFTVVVDSVADPLAEYELLRELWHTLDSLRRVFPMLGEVEVLTPTTLAAWSRFSILGAEVSGWRALIGGEMGDTGYVATAQRSRFDACNHALFVYRDYLLPRLFERTGARAVNARAIRRVAAKIARYAAIARDVKAPPHVDSVIGALRELDDAVRSIDLTDLWCDASTPLSATSRALPRAGQTIDLGARGTAVESVIDALHWTIVILRDDALRMDDSFLRELPPLVGHDRPLVFTRSVFDYLVRFLDPFLYTHLLHCGSVVFGKAELPEPPSASSFAHAVLLQSHNILTAPRSREVFPPFDAGFISGRGFEIAVERALFARFLLDRGAVSPWFATLTAESEAAFSDEAQRARDIRARGDGTAAFQLLRELAADVAKGILDTHADTQLFRGEGTPRA